MKTRFLTFLVALFCLSISFASAREIINFDENWKFARFGAMPDGSKMEDQKNMFDVGFDDSQWRTLNLPHDWGIEGPFRDDLQNSTGKLPWVGIGWYRKQFQLPESDKDKMIFIEFDGSMSRTTVWVNGGYVGEWAYGYSSFQFDITRYLKFGQQNTVAVRLDNKPESSRWYPGGGIYRNVRLVKTNSVHVNQWGVFVTTTYVSDQRATVDIKTEVKGATEGVEILHEIYTQGNDPVKVAEKRVTLGTACSIEIKSPRIWSLETPNMYDIKTTLFKDGKPVDTYNSSFGIRTIEFSADKGFLLNGKVVKIKGVCRHSDLGALGTAINVRAIERQIEILKEFGCNAIRTSHNPPSPEFLNLCDRMGMLVDEEAFDAWQKPKLINDYSSLFGAWHERDLRAMVRRDRNHPSVIMWSLGNELIEFQDINDAPLSLALRDIVHSEDTTRPTTYGTNRMEAINSGFYKTSEVLGLNYKPMLYDELHKSNPNLPIYGSETASSISSRGEYFFPVSENKSQGNGGNFQVSSYDLYASGNGNIADIEFKAQDMNPNIFGEFVWTGFDYIGEPTPYNKDKTNLLNYADPVERERMKEEMKKLGSNIPPRSSYFGIVDLCGFPKDRFYLYQAHWRPDFPMAHILPHWNWPERIGKVTPVFVYTSGDEAELYLNGKSLGRKKKGQYEYRLRWDDVVYKPGELKVIAYKNGKVWAQDIVKTTKVASKLALSADRSVIAADGSDLSFVTVKVTDKAGLVVPRTHNTVKYTLTGPGEIIAVDNGDATSHESFQATERKVFNGLALVVIRSKKGEKGKIELTATSDGLKTNTLEINTK
ncbi:MAG: beta-galactosidase GalB [Bacteroidales bacterium]